jgi:polysaccharide biosynthesis/export protein
MAAGALATATGAAAADPAAAPPPASASPAAATDQSYVLGPDDVIEIQVLGRPEFTTRARIGEDGSIRLPYLGTVSAASRTADVLGDQVGKALEAGGYYAKPIMKVEIVSYASRYVTVLGDVGTPGLIPVDRPYHLSEVIARVGGVRAEGADFVDLKPVRGPERQIALKALATGDASSDPLVTPGDKIFVDKATLFYISGQVKSPGAYPFESGMTLRMAIARGGGLTDLGTEHGVKVTDPDGKALKLRLDDSIQAHDVIVVGERMF